MNKELKKYGLNSSQCIYLIHLFKVDNISQEELSKALCIDKSATARAIKQLEDNGFVERVSSPYDKRVKLVRCTEKGFTFKI